MEVTKFARSWKAPLLLLSAIGLSNIGDWIYLIALNLIVLEMTGSPLAVAVLYILKPLASLLTNVWAGSFIDRVNQRRLMVAMDIIRAILIVLLPFLSSLWMIYSIVFIVHMASAVFVPASMTYITKLVVPEKRKRFNSLRGFIDSGGFLVGPAVAGVLFMLGNPHIAMYVNAATFFLSGMMTRWLPNLEENGKREPFKLSKTLIKNDWAVVVAFSRKKIWVMWIYFLFGFMMVMATALDSLEAAFSKEVLLLSDTTYGFLVSLAGAGIALGSLVTAYFSNKMSIFFLLGYGSLFVAVGYLIYAFSEGFFMAAIGFFILSFSLAFANTGFHTFYQDHIPVHVMGRVASVFGFVEGILIIMATVLIGVGAQWGSIKSAVLIGSFVMLGITLMQGMACTHMKGKKGELVKASTG
ncbi:MFS transporter [Halobacillus karajensis]|uniref:2-acyl-glycerophospho-ethanolamine acyltransferase n=1 Tax=Halobacillus karajensis TaxID=195088 RepID=A0A024P9T2_9BACI|nr:MFS transporter [Halobacillus karajensis]CDQ20167.1 2-acyl-glycerophospho-ethanolamine acyltransferase [Halobacillus karajensis]CDQ25172.1 2-acyl-glycerophospho-ethanolamine acyltransferase [Halobacillus karajensis]CDQ28467.1 2-acyl-glycerophospho-ethanolamine acyltransferase [Halobacillus karajensis]